MEIVKEKTNVNIINAWENRRILVNEKWYASNFIISKEKIIPNWSCMAIEEICIENLSLMADLDPEIILIGTGNDQIFINPEIPYFFNQKKIGIEIMNTPSACRTYNLLAHELRKVVAGIII